MHRNLNEWCISFGTKHGSYEGAIFVYRIYKLPRVRHNEPFAKRRAGQLRRDERRFAIKQKENYTWLTPPASPE